MALSLAKTNPVLRPVMTKVDLHVTYPLLVKRGLAFCKNKAIEHKFKTFLLVMGMGGAYVSYGFYKTVRMFFDPFGLGGSASGDLDQSSPQANQSQKQLRQYLEEDSQNKLSIEIFQKTQNSVKDFLPNQIGYICKNVVEAHFKLQEASDRTRTSEQITSEQKFHNWNYLTQQLLKTLLGEVYSVRIMNLIAVVQFTQGGKMFLQIEKRYGTQEKSNPDSSSDPNRSTSEQGTPEEELKQQQKKDQMKAEVSQQSDQFIQDIYQLVISPVLAQTVLPLVDKLVTEVLSQRSMSPKSRITLSQFHETMTFIHNKILTQLFQPVDIGTYDYSERDDNDGSEESGDEHEDEVRSDPTYRYYLSDLISKQYEEVLAQGETNNFKPESLKKELSDELLDIIETEYFAGALYELVQASFTSTIQDYLQDYNRKQAAQGASSAVSPSKRQGTDAAEEKIAVAKLTTQFFQLQNQEFISEQMSSDMRNVLSNSPLQQLHQPQVQDLPAGANPEAKLEEYMFNAELWAQHKALLNQLIKFVFFGNQRVFSIDIEDMMGDLDRFAPEEEIGDLFRELLGGMQDGDEAGGDSSGGTAAQLNNFMKSITGGTESN